MAPRHVTAPQSLGTVDMATVGGPAEVKLFGQWCAPRPRAHVVRVRGYRGGCCAGRRVAALGAGGWAR